MEPVQVLDPATDPAIFESVKVFLNELNSSGGKPVEELSPAEARQVLIGAQQSVETDLSGVDVAEKNITQDGITVKLHIVRPSDTLATLPVFIFIHGGGWVLGDFPTHQRLVRDLVLYSGAAAVFVDYTPSPEAQYPTAIHEIYAATKWVAEHGSEINVDGKRLAVVGNSVGGNMTAVTALMAKENQGPAIQLQVLLWPVTDASFDTESYHAFATGRFLTRNMMIWFWDNYTKDAEARKSIYASPLQATLEQLKGLPPALVQTAENDVLRDEGEAYARKLEAAGVPVTLTRHLGLIHDYGLLNPIATIPAIQGALAQAGAALKKALR